MKKFLVALLLVGCGSFERLPGQDDAERIVWHELYGETGAPPPIEWIDAETLDGTDYTGRTLPGWRGNWDLADHRVCRRVGAVVSQRS